MKVEEELHYPSIETKGADRGLPRSWIASLFSHMQIVGFLMRRLICNLQTLHLYDNAANQGIKIRQRQILSLFAT